MGTRSLTKVYDQFDGKIICTMFVHFDGYPTGVGADIKNALQGVTVVNGMNGSEVEPFVNRMGQLVSYLVRKAPCNFEFTEAERSSEYIDFTYHLRFESGRVLLSVDSWGEEVYSGLLDEFDPQKVEDNMYEAD